MREFEKGKKYRFSSEKYRWYFPKSGELWVDQSNGQEVVVMSPTYAKLGNYPVSPAWCEEIKEN